MKITVEDLSFAYVSKQIFTNLNLSFEQGSRTGIMAPTGFGKTTLLHLLAGILDPQAGSITRPERVSFGVPRASATPDIGIGESSMCDESLGRVDSSAFT